VKKLSILFFFIPLALSSLACGFPTLNDQLFNYSQYRSSALFGNSAYAALHRGTGLALATQSSSMGSYNSLTGFTSFKNYTLQLNYGEIRNEFNLNQNVSFGLSRKFDFQGFSIATGLSLNAGKSIGSFNRISGSERFKFQTGWEDFNSFSDQYVASSFATVVEYKNLRALLSLNDVLLKSVESQMLPKTLNAGLTYKHQHKSIQLTHGFNYSKRAYNSQLLGFSSGTYKFLEVGFGFKYRDTEIQALMMLGIELGKYQLSYAYTGTPSTSGPAVDIHTPLQAAHEASLAWNLNK